jgi:hypothetical protein
MASPSSPRLSILIYKRLRNSWSNSPTPSASNTPPIASQSQKGQSGKLRWAGRRGLGAAVGCAPRPRSGDGVAGSSGGPAWLVAGGNSAGSKVSPVAGGSTGGVVGVGVSLPGYPGGVPEPG